MLLPVPAPAPPSTLHPADGKKPHSHPLHVPHWRAGYLPNGTLKIDIIHGSRDTRAAGMSLSWKGKTNCISYQQQHSERGRGMGASLPQGCCLRAGGTHETLAGVPFPVCALLLHSQEMRAGFGVSPPSSSVGLQVF